MTDDLRGHDYRKCPMGTIYGPNYTGPDEWNHPPGWSAAKEKRKRQGLSLAAIGLEHEAIMGILDATLTGEAIEVTRAWYATPVKVLVLAGPVGTGKTVAAAWAAHEASDQHRAECIPARDIAQRHLAFERDRARWPELPSHGFVVLDDLGAQTDSRERFNAALCTMLDSAVSGGLRIVATSNLTVDELRAMLDDRCRDRLNHVGKLALITGKSMRTQGGGF